MITLSILNTCNTKETQTLTKKGYLISLIDQVTYFKIKIHTCISFRNNFLIIQIELQKFIFCLESTLSTFTFYFRCILKKNTSYRFKTKALINIFKQNKTLVTIPLLIR